jgi:hypothetical protein
VRPVDAIVENCGEDQFGPPKIFMGNRAVANVVPIDASYLREQAHRLVRLARDCPHRPTSHQLEIIGMELMEKASEVDALLSDSSRE